MKLKGFIIISMAGLSCANIQAQNIPEMSSKEKKEIMGSLELEYKMLTGEIPPPASSIATPKLQKINTLPWQDWAKKNNAITYEQALRSLASIRLEASEQDSNACCITWRVPKSVTPKFHESYFGAAYMTNLQGNRIGLCNNESRVLSGIGIEIEIHLTDRKGNQVFIDPQGDKYFMYEQPVKDDFTWEETELWKQLIQKFQIPLDRPFSEVAGGYIDVLLYCPQKYDWKYMTKEDIGKKIELAGTSSIRLDDIRNGSFLVSSYYTEADRMNDYLAYYGHINGSTWSASSSGGHWGDLSTLWANLQVKDGKLTFEQWLHDCGIDPDHLENSYSMIEENYEIDPWHRKMTRAACDFVSIAIKDSILLYMPYEQTEWKALEGKRIYTPTLGKKAETLPEGTTIIGNFTAVPEQIPDTIGRMYDRTGGWEEYNRFSEKEARIDFFQFLEILHHHGIDVPTRIKEAEEKQISFDSFINKQDVPLYKYERSIGKVTEKIWVDGTTGKIIQKSIKRYD